MTSSPSSPPSLPGLLISVESGVCFITLNRPKRKNAFDKPLYLSVVSALDWAGHSDSVVVAVLTGSGNFYSSGNDLGNFAFSGADASTPQELSHKAGELLTKFVSAFVDFPKPLIAAVNGPAIGVAATTLGLCDVVYASEDAYFETPFAKLGQSPEGVSSLLFPMLMGFSKANEVLLMGKRLSAREAEQRNLVAEVFPTREALHEAVRRRAMETARKPSRTLCAIKGIIRKNQIDLLRRTNEREVALLEKLWVSEECMNAIMAFMQEAAAKRSRRRKQKKQRSKL